MLKSIPLQLQWLLVAFVALSLIYAWATPIFEASDELWHFGLVDHLAGTWELPVQVVVGETAWEQEGSQPPLYYFIAAALVSPFDRSDIDSFRQPNLHTKAGIPGDSDNKNLVLHDGLVPPLEKTALAVYFVRLFSIALGMVTVSAVYASAQLVGGKRVAVLAAGITAFNPMFLFITASVNNDNLVTALNSVIVYLMLRLLRDGFDFRHSVIIAVLIALATLSKLSGLALVPVVALSACWVAYRRRNWRGLVTLGVLMAGLWALLAGWWYLRNLTLYGELFGTATMAAVAGVREGTFTLQTLFNEFEGFRIAYWGLFGAVNILTCGWFYVLMDVLVVLALVGLTLHLWRKRSDMAYLVKLCALLLIIVIGSVSVIAWTAQTYASQGRLLFPYVAATSTLLAVGLTRWLNVRVGHGLVAFLLIFAFIVPFISIAPQYIPPPVSDHLPSTARQVDARFGDVALIGYETPDARYQPGESVPVTVYWQVRKQSDRDYSLFLTPLDDQGQAIGKIDSYPGGGRLRTTTWKPGAIYADPYTIRLSSEATGQFRLRMQVGWWDYPTETYLNPQAGNGESLESVILDLGGFFDPDSRPTLESPQPVDNVNFGGVIALTGYQLTSDLVDLAWESTGVLDDDYTVFVQVLDDANNVIGQGDAPPALPTHYWQPGEHFVTHHALYYPEPPAAGDYRLLVGWYRPDDFARLGVDYPDSAYPLATITIP